jgi:hypothetical protein
MSVNPQGNPDDLEDDYEPSRSVDAGRPLGRFLMQVLWPAFLGAAAASGLFFSAVDPLEVNLVGIHLEGDRLATYTLGFLVFWVLFALSGALTYMLVNTESGRSH